jgi:HAD superfamily hydrolase (TIGR01509 family)
MTEHNSKARPQPAFLFDLDGTLIDSVYQHVLAWREALEAEDIHLPNWYIHRRIGMSGGLIVHAFLREAKRKLDAKEIARLQKLHTEAFMKRVETVRVLPGANDLLETLSRLGVRWAIATSGSREGAEQPLKLLGLGRDVPVITRDDVQRAKPDPDLFLAAAHKLGASLEDCVVVGDSIWDLLAAQRARALGVGLLSGGFGEDELMNAGAYRVYRDPADLNMHLDEIGIRGV